MHIIKYTCDCIGAKLLALRPDCSELVFTYLGIQFPNASEVISVASKFDPRHKTVSKPILRLSWAGKPWQIT